MPYTMAKKECGMLVFLLSSIAKISDSLLDFQSSLNAEVEASVLIGRQLNFQRARELALNNDIAGATKQME